MGRTFVRSHYSYTCDVCGTKWEGLNQNDIELYGDFVDFGVKNNYLIDDNYIDTIGYVCKDCKAKILPSLQEQIKVLKAQIETNKTAKPLPKENEQ